MRLVFDGLVELGDPCRVDWEDKDGAIIVGGRDVVGEISDNNWRDNKITVGIADETFEGELFVETGWGYSEYTPMDSDELRVGDHDLIEILSRYEGQSITLYLSDEPINLLDPFE